MLKISILLALSCLTASGFEIESVVWCQDVTDRMPVGGTIINSDRPQMVSSLSTLVFWTKLIGTDSDIDRMRLQHKLPIRHIWEFEQNDRLYIPPQHQVSGQSEVIAMPAIKQLPQKIIPHATIVLDLGSPQTFDTLKKWVAWNHYFSWRTWSDVTALYPGTWQVTVEYADGSPVYCRGKIAIYQITLQ
jgi:hypothetical protein